MPVVGDREAAADVEDLDVVAAALRLSRTAAAMLSAWTKFSKFVHWLPTWKLSPSTTSPIRNASSIRSTASPGSQPNLEDSSTIEPVFGTRRRSTSPACGACLLDLLQLRPVVVGDERA